MNPLDPQSDERIRVAILDTPWRHIPLRWTYTQVDVSVQDGIVTLIGTVGSIIMKRVIVDEVSWLPDVCAVWADELDDSGKKTKAAHAQSEKLMASP